MRPGATVDRRRASTPHAMRPRRAALRRRARRGSRTSPAAARCGRRRSPGGGGDGRRAHAGSRRRRAADHRDAAEEHLDRGARPARGGLTATSIRGRSRARQRGVVHAAAAMLRAALTGGSRPASRSACRGLLRSAPRPSTPTSWPGRRWRRVVGLGAGRRALRRRRAARRRPPRSARARPPGVRRSRRARRPRSDRPPAGLPPHRRLVCRSAVGTRVALADIPLLFETGHRARFRARGGLCLRCRRSSSGGWSRAIGLTAKRKRGPRLAAQWPIAEKVAPRRLRDPDRRHLRRDRGAGASRSSTRSVWRA